MRKRNKREIVMIIIVALFTAVLFNLNDIIIFYKNYIAGQSYNFFSFIAGDERLSILPGFRDISDGNWRSSDAMTFENTRFPYLHPAFNYWLLSPLVLLFKSYNIYFPVGRYIVAIAAFFILYKLANLLVRNKIFSLIYSYVFLIGGLLFYFLFPTSSFNIKAVIRTFFPIGSPPVDVMPGHYIGLSIVPSLLIFLCASLLLYLFITTKKRAYLISSGIIIGILVDSYPLSGLYLWSVCGIIFLGLLLNKEFILAKNLVWVILLSCITAIPAFLNQIQLMTLPWADDVYWRTGGEFTHAFRWSHWPEYLAYIGLAVILWRWGKNEKRSIAAVYLIGFALAPIILYNIQVITGYNPVPTGYYTHQIYIGFGLCWLAVLHWLYKSMVNKNERYKIATNIFLTILVILFTVRMIGANVAKANNIYRYHYLPKNIKASMEWLDQNTDVNSVVATPSLVTNSLLASDTHNRVIVSPGVNSSLSQYEILDRWYLVYSLFGISPQYLKDVLAGKLPVREDYVAVGDNGVRPAMFYYYFQGRTLDAYFKKIDTSVPDDYLNNMVEYYKNYPKRLCYLLSRYKIDYLFLGPLEREITGADFGKKEWLEKVYNQSDIAIFKVKENYKNQKCKI